MGSDYLENCVEPIPRLSRNVNIRWISHIFEVQYFKLTWSGLNMGLIGPIPLCVAKLTHTNSWIDQLTKWEDHEMISGWQGGIWATVQFYFGMKWVLLLVRPWPLNQAKYFWKSQMLSGCAWSPTKLFSNDPVCWCCFWFLMGSKWLLWSSCSNTLMATIKQSQRLTFRHSGEWSQLPWGSAIFGKAS
jgi:hypothetical protein